MLETKDGSHKNIDCSQAVNCMEAIMQKYPEGIAIICAHNDDIAMAAARSAKDNAAYKDTIFLGFNGDRAACEAILAGQETMSVIQDAYGMGYKGVETAVAHLNGETVETFVDSGSGVVDINSAQERLDELMTLQSEISLAFNQSRVGSEIDVIVDDFVDGVYVCRSEFESPEVDGEILVRYDSAVMGDVDPYSLVGEFIKVRVIGADEYDLIAEPVEI